MRRVGLFLALVTVLLAVIGFVFTRSANAPQTPSNSSVTLKQFSDKTHGVAISYPDSANLSALTDTDKADRFIFIANGQQNSKPYKIYLKYEDGLRAATAVTKLSVLDFMLENLEKSYPKQFPDYNKISERRFQLNGRDAVEVTFSYISNREPIKQKIMLVTKDSNKAFYLSMQAKSVDYDSLQPVFEAFTNSLAVQ